MRVHAGPLAGACSPAVRSPARGRSVSPRRWPAAPSGMIVDWEDAVAPGDKAVARAALAQALLSITRHPTAPAWPCVSTPKGRPGTPTIWPRCRAGRAPGSGRRGAAAKADSTAGVAAAARARAHGAVLPLVESVAGLDAVRTLAAAPQVLRLLFGHLDFQADAGLACGPGEEELVPVRLQIVLASRAAGLPAPVDGVTPDTSDLQLVQGHAARALRGGFGSKLCIHPAQVAALHAAFAPSPETADWARRVVEGFAEARGGVFTLDGRMVDAPVVKLAEQMLARARVLGVAHG